MTTEKEKALELALSQIEKQFGKGSVMRLGEVAARSPVEAIPSGSLALDLALGVGGIPRGRITEIFGPEASGKTTLGQHVIAEAQKRGGMAAYQPFQLLYPVLESCFLSGLGVELTPAVLPLPMVK